MIEEIVKGDSVDFECNMGEDITGWEIRAEVWDDDDNIVEKASANSGGSDAQIEITDAVNGIFVLHLAVGDTANFGDFANLEIEVGIAGKVYTTLKDAISFVEKRINWTTPTANPPS